MSKKWRLGLGVVAAAGIVWFIVTLIWLPVAFEDIGLPLMDVDMSGDSNDDAGYLEKTDVTIGPFVIKASPFHLIYFVLSIGLISFALLFDLANPFLCRCCLMLFSRLNKWKTG